jgi:GNAT superfamily N-acetyltransferase
MADHAVDVYDLAAGTADQVVMVVPHSRLVSRQRAGRLDPPDETGIGEGAEYVVHRLVGHLRKLLTGGPQERVGVGVRMPVDGSEDRHPRPGDPERGRAEHLLEFGLTGHGPSLPPNLESVKCAAHPSPRNFPTGVKPVAVTGRLVDAGGVEITRLLPDDEAGCVDAVAVQAAALKLDCPEMLLPTPAGFANRLRYGWDMEPEEAYLARDADGIAVGLLVVSIPTYDNTNQVWIDVAVHPDHRGRGVGSALVEYAEQKVRALGRNLIGFGGFDLPKADAFARHHGFEQKAVEVNRRQDLAGLDWSVVQSLYDEAVAASTAYELIKLTAELPEDLVDGMVAVTASINDAPRDDLDMEDDVFSPERLRAYEQAQRLSNHTVYRVIAREKATGALAGHTVIAVERERPHIGEQHDTAVAREHRGHRLGALVKTAMLLWLREAEPALSQIDTWNAESNNHMIGINEQLNYTIVARLLAYQKTIQL